MLVGCQSLGRLPRGSRSEAAAMAVLARLVSLVCSSNPADYVGELGAGFDLELAVDAAEVYFHGFDRDEEGLGDLLVAMPSAAIRATRRSLGVSASTPVNASVRGRAPVAANSSCACLTSRSAPAR